MLSSAAGTVATRTEPPYEAEEGWYNLLQRVTVRQVSTAQALSDAESALAASADQRWVLPLAMALWTESRHRDALKRLLEPAVAQACNQIWLYHNLIGMVARKLDGESQRAIAAYERSLELEPLRADTLYNYANLLKDDDPERAIGLYRRSLALEPQAPAAWHNFGTALNNSHAYDEALVALRISLQLDALVADVWCNLGLAYFGAERFDCAERCFRHAIALDASHAASHTNLGNALINVLQPEEALQYLERGVELDQSSTHSLWNLALAYLLLGHYGKGWPYYEVRFDNEDFAHVPIPTGGARLRDLAAAPRQGDPALVVWSEQGLGDAIQFCRYLPMLDAAGIPFVFLTRPPLLQLMREWTGLGERVKLLGSTQPEHDSRPHVALLSLPHLFGTELDCVPCTVPYLYPPSQPADHLRLITPPGGLAIGLVWASNPDNKAMYRNKSLPLALLMPLFERLIDLDLIELHSLQFGDDADQLAPWRHMAEVHDWNNRLENFAETAQVLRQLDLVITVDTAVAHLAGALNKPTWVLLPQNADFRWLRQRSDSPWYPSMRLFRQKAHGDWASVASQLDQAFDTMLLLDTQQLLKARMA
jgi:tetratricopeptide (TPR) repeat protein